MKKKALVIMDSANNRIDFQSLLADSDVITELHATGAKALAAFTTGGYNYVIVSMEIEREDPLKIIGSLREAEKELGLLPTQVLVAGRTCELSQSEIVQYNICGIIRSHVM